MNGRVEVKALHFKVPFGKIDGIFSNK
jgi:hypothetical protein